MRHIYFLLLLVILYPSIASPTDKTAQTSDYYQRLCRDGLNALSRKYSEHGSDTHTLATLPVGEWAISEKHGLIRVLNWNPETRTLEVSTPGQTSRSSVWFKDVDPNTKVALLGTQAARDITAARAKHFAGDVADTRLFFAYAAVYKLINAPVSGGSKAHSVLIAEGIWEKMKAGHPEYSGKSFDEFFALGERQLKASPNYRAAFSEFVREYYRQTGLNLVQSGLLTVDLEWGKEGGIHFTSMGMQPTSTPFGAHIGSKYGAVSLPVDVIHQIVVDSWKSSEEDLASIGRSSVTLANYVPDSAPGGDSDQIRAFKDSGNLGAIEPILARRHTNPAYQAWLENVRKQEGGTMILPVPGSDTGPGANSVLAEWVQREIGPSAAVNLKAIGGSHGRPQKSVPDLWSRIDNIRERSYTVQNVAGKNIVLVEDNITTGATIERLKLELMAKGARSVHVFSLAKTGSPPELQRPESILKLNELPVPQTEALPTTWNDLKPIAEAAVAAGTAFPWEVNLAKPSPPEKKARAAFQQPFQKNDFMKIALLPESVLSKVDPNGRQIFNGGRETYVQRLKTDEGILITTLLALYNAPSNKEALKQTDWYRLFDEGVRKSLTSPSFANQMREMDPQFQRWVTSNFATPP